MTTTTDDPAFQKPKGPGQPSLIDQPLTIGDDTRTVAEHLVEAIRGGNYIETAAAMTGVGKSTVYGWLKLGADASRKLDKGLDITEHEAKCRAFSDAVVQAQAQSEALDVAMLGALGRGGRKVVHVTEKRDKNNRVVEKVTRTETLPPSERALQWRLERRFPDRWGRKVELSGPNGGPIEIDQTPSERLLATLAALADRQAAADRVAEDLAAVEPGDSDDTDDPSSTDA